MKTWKILKIIIGFVPIRLRTELCKGECRRKCFRKHLQNYCVGLAMASAIGALSGTIPWSWALLTHAVTVAVYWLFSMRRGCGGCEVDDVKTADLG